MAESEKVRLFREADEIQEEIRLQEMLLTGTFKDEVPDAKKNIAILRQGLADKLKEVGELKD